MPEQLPEIPLARGGHPDFGKALRKQKVENDPGIAFVGLLFAHFAGANLGRVADPKFVRSEEHTSELQSQSNLVCRLLLEKKHTMTNHRLWRAKTHRSPIVIRRVQQISSAEGAGILSRATTMIDTRIVYLARQRTGLNCTH